MGRVRGGVNLMNNNHFCPHITTLMDYLTLQNHSLGLENKYGFLVELEVFPSAEYRCLNHQSPFGCR